MLKSRGLLAAITGATMGMCTLQCERASNRSHACGAVAAQLGLLAGGLADGTVCLWDPAKVIDAPSGTEDVAIATVSKLTKHHGGVRPPCIPTRRPLAVLVAVARCGAGICAGSCRIEVARGDGSLVE